MTKRSRENEPGKLHEDANEIAFRTVQAAIGEDEKPVPPEERTGGCGLFRRIVYVGNAQTGGATALAIEDAKDGSSALLFSTDGRVLYYSVGGKLYVADVP